MKTPKDI